MDAILFTKEQNRLFQKHLDERREELWIWNVVNVIVPIVIILIPVFFYAFLQKDKQTFQNLFLNGAFSVLGINALFSMSTYLINSTTHRAVKIENQILSLRKRLIIYMVVLLIFGAIFYFIQIGSNVETTSNLFLVTFGLLLSVYLSISIGKKIYMISDDFMGTTYNEEIKEAVQDLKEATNDLD